jgi:hypothetical protein
VGKRTPMVQPNIQTNKYWLPSETP